MASGTYDVIVIGGGAAGLVASKLAKGLGKSVVVIEKQNRLGGECTWTGCVPSKTLIKTAHVAHEFQNLNRFGLRSNAIKYDTSAVMDHVRATVREVYKTHTPDVITQLGIDIIWGDPEFLDSHTIRVNGNTVRGEKIMICTGSSPLVPPIEGIDSVPYLTNETLFDLEDIPPSMIIVGGGAIGVEMASAFSRLGCAVTIVELADRILPKEDQDMVDIIMREYAQEGITIATGMRATRVEHSGDTITLTCQDAHGSLHTVTAEKLLIAVGRKPNVGKLGLERIGVRVEPQRVVVNKYLQTDVKHIFACGDVVGPYQFSHMAFYQASRAMQNALLPFKRSIHYDNVVWVTFCSPELATAGLTEAQARQAYGDSILVYTKAYADLDRAHTEADMRGMGKFICDSKGYIIGAHIVGARAGDIIHEVQLAKSRGIKLEDLYPVIHAYPTYSELVWHSAKNRYIAKLKGNKLLAFVQWLYSYMSK